MEAAPAGHRITFHCYVKWADAAEGNNDIDASSILSAKRLM